MKKILVLHHYYRPDDVAGSVHFTGLCEGLAKRGWKVEIWPSNRSCHHYGDSYPTKLEVLEGVKVRRVYRPAWRQHSFLGRVANAAWVLSAWCWRALSSPSPDVVLTGTDPLFALAATPFFKWRFPKAKMVHWAFDLYPEYPIADGILRENTNLVRVIRAFLKKAYGACDLIVDLGPCMRELLKKYPIKSRSTLTPWAQEEPLEPLVPNLPERKKLFGEAGLGLLYSGNFGRPHGFEQTLALARRMRDKAVFAYSARGSRLEELKTRVEPQDLNVKFVSFTAPEKLAARLSAPDIHIVSLMPHWRGVAVPSKFFGALAVGRPVLFEGDENSDIAGWIRKHKVGWVLTPQNLESVREDLVDFSEDPWRKNDMFLHCHQVYQEHFSLKFIMDKWDQELRALFPETVPVRRAEQPRELAGNVRVPFFKTNSRR